jgi:hypothetical protein
MLEGQWYSVDYTAFAGYLGISEDELQRDRIHTEGVLPPERMAYMYRGGQLGRWMAFIPPIGTWIGCSRSPLIARVVIRVLLQITLGTFSTGWHQMHNISVSLTSSGVRSRVLVRGPSRDASWVLTLCI